MKKVIITGILGQDGSHLAEYLLSEYQDIQVYGLMKRGSNPNTNNIKSIIGNPRFKVVLGDITDQTSMDSLVKSLEPDYLINFAANSFVGTSWDTPEQVFNVNTLGVLKCLESIRKFRPSCRFYSAGSSEEYGETLYNPQDEKHILTPVSPYGVTKSSARYIVNVYRKSYGLFAVHGTLFNHEGPRRGTEFVTRKITKNIASILKNIDQFKPVGGFSLGNIFAKKDLSDSRDMVRGVWAIINHHTPEDFVLASGTSRSIADFVEIGFKTAGYAGNWVYHDDLLQDYFEICVHGVWVKVVTIDKNLFRPSEVGLQEGNSAKARSILGWEPRISFEQMVLDMVENDKSLIS